MYEKLEKMVESNPDLEVVVDFLGGKNTSYKYYAKLFNTYTQDNIAIVPGCSVDNALISLNNYVEIHNL